MDACHPGTFSFGRVKWEAKFDYEWMENYKILQEVFKKQNISKKIDITKLVKARPLDNIEFLQWLKAYFDANYQGEAYNALARRKNKDLWLIGAGGKVTVPKPGDKNEPSTVQTPRQRPSTAMTKTPQVQKANTMRPTSARPATANLNSSISRQNNELASQIQEMKL